nr:C665 [uncultured bacterium]ART36905.1 D57 [uncultured bacterium]
MNKRMLLTRLIDKNTLARRRYQQTVYIGSELCGIDVS